MPARRSVMRMLAGMGAAALGAPFLNLGRIGILLGLQNAEHFRKQGDVNAFHGLGQRVAQLTYNARNLLGNGATERRETTSTTWPA